MDFYFTYESSLHGRLLGKNTAVFQAESIQDAFVQASEMLAKVKKPESKEIEETAVVGSIIMMPDKSDSDR